MNGIITINDKRASLSAFENEVIARIGGNPIVNESDLILEAVISKNGQLVFNIVANNTQRASELRLSEKDIFCMTHALVGIRKYKKVGDKHFPVTDIITFANPEIFTGVSADGIKEADALKIVYNALLGMKTSRKARIADFSTRNFLHVPLMSQNDVLSYGTDDEGRGFYSFVQSQMLSGKSTTAFEITLPASEYQEVAIGDFDETGKAANTYNTVVIVAKGYLAVDSASNFEAWLPKSAN
jgi:hypothetical protein